MDLPEAFLLRSWEGLYYWNVFGDSVNWTYAFQVGENQSFRSCWYGVPGQQETRQNSP